MRHNETLLIGCRHSRYVVLTISEQWLISEVAQKIKKTKKKVGLFKRIGVIEMCWRFNFYGVMKP